MPKGTPIVSNREALLNMMQSLEERLQLLRDKDKQKDQVRRFIAKRPDLTRTDIMEIARDMPKVRIMSPHAIKVAAEKRAATQAKNQRKRANGHAAKKKKV